MTVITLNDTLKFTDDSSVNSTGGHDPRRLAKYWGYDRQNVLEYVSGTTDRINLKNHGLFGLISHAYKYHKSVTINPTDVWILILSQFKTIIKENVEFYRHLFTDSPEKTEISVPTNSLYELPVESVIARLNEYIKFDSKLVRVEFSTDTPIANEVKNHLLLDMASPYFNYSMFLCGIPSIKIGGEVEDWERLENAFLQLNEIFYLKDNDEYLNWQCSVAHIASVLLSAAKGDYDVDFFGDIFTQRNVGSGGDLEIKGWITSLFYKLPKVPKIENFNSHISCIEYKNKSTNKDYIMLSGGFNYKIDEYGFYSLEYSKHIFDKVAIPKDRVYNPHEYTE